MPDSRYARACTIALGLPVQVQGVTLYPLTMEHYEEYQECKPVLLIRQSTLPAAYISMPFLEALFALDMECVKAQHPAGMISKMVRLLGLALHMDTEDASFTMTGPGGQLKDIRIGELVITPVMFSHLRRTIAEQNGDVLPDESENIEIIQAEKDLAEMHEANVDVNVWALMDVVAYESHTSLSDVLTWTIRAFEQRRKTIRRGKMFTLFKQAEMTGLVKFKDGNPWPDYEFEPKKGISPALIPEDNMLKKFGNGATIKE